MTWQRRDLDTISVVLLASSQALMIAFVVTVAAKYLTLSDSSLTGKAGMTLCVLGLLLQLAPAKENRKLFKISMLLWAGAQLCMWLFWQLLH